MSWHPDISEEYRNTVVCGDARELTKAIPDNSIDLIFTDPVYEDVEMYAWLASEARRILKKDKPCLVWGWIGLLPDYLDAMRPFLSYRWLISNYTPGKVSAKVYCPIGYNKWTPILWFDKGKAKNPRWMDCYQTRPFSGEDRYFNHHKWSKSTESISEPLLNFSKEGDVVLDTFCGGGTIPVLCKRHKRRWIAFEIDKAIAEDASRWITKESPLIYYMADNSSLF